MKLNTALVIALVGTCIALVCSSLQHVQAQSPRQPHAAIVIGYREIRGPINENSYSPTIGMQVEWISASQHCPPIPQGSALGPVIAELLEQGFRFETITGSGRCLLVR